MSAPLVLLLVRHGQIVQHPEQRRFVGATDLPLDETGAAQARALGATLAGLERLGLLPGRVFTSDLSRSIDTAALATAGLQPGLEPVRLPGLREICLGEWEGLTAGEVRQRFPGQLECRGADLAGYRPPGGENFSDLLERALPALDEVARRAVEGGERLALVVAHGGVNRAVLCQALGLSLNHALRLPQSYACLNILVLRPEGMELRAVNLASGALAPGWAAAYGLGGFA